jgi:hypothetical protein
LLEINREDFIKAQKNSPDLQPLFDQVRHPRAGNPSFGIERGILVKTGEDKFGRRKKLLVVPVGLRNHVKILSHENTSCHLGCTKSKGKMIRHFYWPNCFKEMAEFVRSCDQCQRAGNDHKNVDSFSRGADDKQKCKLD